LKYPSKNDFAVYESKKQSQTANLNEQSFLALFSFQKRFQTARARRMAQFSQSLRLDLANALSGDGEMLPDFFEPVLAAGRAQAEAHFDHFLFARRQGR
jgi:hypothetical protein